MRTLVASLLFLCSVGYGATIPAASAGNSDVQAAINTASNGDTVSVPAGVVVWTVPVTNNYKDLSLVGAGIGQTVILWSNAIAANIGLQVKMKQTNTFTFSGFTFETAYVANFGVINIGNDSATGSPVCQYRITNCKFISSPQSGSGSSGRSIDTSAIYGLIDHCTFQFTNALGGQMITIDRDAVVSTTNTWHTPQFLGDTNCTVIEDCVFDASTGGPNDGAFDAYEGQRVVFRYNIVTNTDIGWHGLDSSVRSCRSFEVYGNKFYAAGLDTGQAGIVCRGGTGVVWSNTFDSGYSICLYLKYYGAYGTNDASGFRAGGAGYINATNQWDGHFDASGYPLADQPGRGSFPAGSTNYWPNQVGYTTNQYEALDPIYQWGNTLNGSAPTNYTWPLPYITNFVIANRDYYDNVAKPGYTPLRYPHPLIAETIPHPTINAGTATIGTLRSAQ